MATRRTAKGTAIEILTGLAAIKQAAERARTETTEAPRPGATLAGGFGLQGVVETLPEQRYPNNYLVTALDECHSADDVRFVIAQATQHGYASDGQTMQLARGKLFELTKGKEGSALSPTLQVLQRKAFAQREGKR